MRGDGGSGRDYDEGFGAGVWEDWQGGLCYYYGVYGGCGEEDEESFEREVVSEEGGKEGVEKG